MRADDLEPALDMWIEAWGGSDRDFARRELMHDPNYTGHTLVALGAPGEVLSAAHYWVREVRDAEGKPRKVGCVSHVATRESARRQGHARRLMRMTIDAMRAEGCEWSLLFASHMSRPLYESLGYRHFSLPYWRGVLSSERPKGGEEYAVRRYDPHGSPDAWKPMAGIFNAYNGQRPLSMVRDEDYWRGYYADRFLCGHSNSENVIITAESSGEVRGYVVAHYLDKAVTRRYFPDFSGLLTVAELCVRPGHEAAIPALLSAVADHAGPGQVGTRAYLPPAREANSAVATLLGETLQQQDDHNPMALSLGGGFAETDIDAMIDAPGAYSWYMDEF
ncbi:MAG: GNAT family N-acetyltransferase [Chloroflexia bacterium]